MQQQRENEMDKQFMKACENGNLDEVLTILYYHDNGPVKLLQTDPNTLNHMHYFHAVCLNGHCDILEQLFNFNVDVNMDSPHGTPLAVACQGGHLKAVELLIQHGAVVFDGNSNLMRTPFFFACKNGHLDVLTYLIEKEPNALLTYGQQLLVEACREGFLDIVVMLVSKRINIDGEDHCRSPSSQAISFDILLDTPLQAACSQNQVEIIRYLLQEGVEVTVNIVQQYYEALGEALQRNFKEHFGKYHRKQEKNMKVYQAEFGNAIYYEIHSSWFTAYGECLVKLDLSKNQLANIPKEIINLPALKEVDFSDNNLFELPEVYNLADSRLEDIRASSNRLRTVPLSYFQLRSLIHLNFSRNEIVSLSGEHGTDTFEMDDFCHDEVTWHCHLLKSLNLMNNKLKILPAAISALTSLEMLQLCDNQLSDFPISWSCPLRILNIAQNQLTNFKQSVFANWSQTLVHLNLSANQLTHISWDICQLQMLQVLDMSHNSIENMPAKGFWACSSLRKLNLSNNKLCGVKVERKQAIRRFTMSRSPTEDDVEIEDEFPYEVFGGSLEILDLSYNKLLAIPNSLCKLISLEDLNLSWNPKLKTLPANLGNLTECFQLGLDGLNLNGIPKYVRTGQYASSKSILAYLRAKQRKAVVYNRMKLMVIGLQGRGKTTLLAALRNSNRLPANISTVGIVVNEWSLNGSQSILGRVVQLGRRDQPSITFSTWDLAGQQIYYSTHQCFLSSNTLYLAVWNVSTGVEGIEKLKPWLLNVQARAPGSRVIIVGTHIDLLPQSGKEKRLNDLRLEIIKRYDKKGYPTIRDCLMVSCTTGEYLPDLRQRIYQVALELKETESHGPGDSLIGRKIPYSYLTLQDNVRKEADQRRKENKPPILNEEEMLALAKRDPNNDILERDELKLAARFLHENGVILHYNDRSRGLDQLYFIEPGWLCEIMALLVTVKENNNFVKGGVIEKSNVGLLLKNPRLPPQFMEQYIQLMERFEVALTLDDNRLLVPSMLPRDKPGLQLVDLRKIWSGNSSSAHTDSTMNTEEGRFSQYLRRVYKMNYVPSGFWSRLIARLMIAVQRWGAEEGLKDGLICADDGKDVRASTHFRPVPQGYSMIYWREGLGVVYEGGHLMVESYSEMERDVHSGLLEDKEGVVVTVWSGEKDFSVLGFVTDQINSLISEWYPGLEESDRYGCPMVQHVIPCPICEENKSSPLRCRRSVSVQNIQELVETRAPEFSLIECAAAAVDHTEIACPYHVDRPVKLSSLVPDIMMSDLPDELVIDNTMFVFNPSDENRLGSGGAGEVFLGMYKKEKVAVKRFHSTLESRSSDSGLGPSRVYGGQRNGSRHTDGGMPSNRSRVFTVTPTSIEEDLQRTKILSSFMELRQEVSVLGRLIHPCVVALIGVSLRPLCIVLELSPLGSLFSILESKIAKIKSERLEQRLPATHDTRQPIFDRNLTYKLVYQVAHALHYLHALGIIYRDLKSDNLLVWSLDEDAIVHVKLSDYGISRFSTPQGMLGEEGTPGFQAPEVRAGSAYNEKVDIFSFAMLIYEILSGLRPFYECRCTAQIKKALRRGERPSLHRNFIDTEMPELETLMNKCWRESADDRPSAETILNLMEDSSFLCLHRSLPYVDQRAWENVTAFVPLADEKSFENMTSGSHSVLFWGGEDSERYYSVIDCKTGLEQVPQTSCVGPRVASLAKVGDRFWLGTEGSVIEVFGRPKENKDLKILWSIKLNAQVLGLEVERFESNQSLNSNSSNSSLDEVRRVFACLANGTIVAISRANLRQQGSTSCSFQFKADATEKLRLEATILSVLTYIKIGPTGTSACCLLLVKDGKELWVGCGNKIGIVETDTLEVVYTFRAYFFARSNVRCMISNGPTVFTMNKKTPNVFQWDVETRQCVCKFYVDEGNPCDLNVARVSCDDREDDAIDGDFEEGVKLDDSNDDDDNTQNEVSMDGSSEEKSFLHVDLSRHHRQPTMMGSLKRTSSRESSRRKKKIAQEKSTSSSKNQGRRNVFKMRSRSQVMSKYDLRVTSILLVRGNLWIGREPGDIVVVDVSDEIGTTEYGMVRAILSTGKERGRSMKGVHKMLRVGNNKVLSCYSLLCKRAPNNDSVRTASTDRTNRSFIQTISPHRYLTPVFSSSSNEAKSKEKIEEFRISVWEAWSGAQFRHFFKYHDDLDTAT